MRRNKKMRIKLIDVVTSHNPKADMREKINTEFDIPVEIQKLEVVDGKVHAHIKLPTKRASMSLSGDLKDMMRQKFGANIVLGS